jgi:hypothetical protein
LGAALGGVIALAFPYRADIASSALEAVHSRPATDAALTVVEWSGHALSTLSAQQRELADSLQPTRNGAVAHAPTANVEVAPSLPVATNASAPMSAPAGPLLASGSNTSTGRVERTVHWHPLPRALHAPAEEPVAPEPTEPANRTFYVATNLDGPPTWREQRELPRPTPVSNVQSSTDGE